MRLFLAIELPPEVRQHLIQVRDHLKSGLSNLSFTRDENLHITLKFLGEVEPRRLDELVKSLSLVRISGPIELFAQQIEFYPHHGPIRIIAAGFSGQLPALDALHRAIEQRARHLGFDRETRKYRPHTTLGRAKGLLPPSVRQTLMTAAKLFPGPIFSAKEFALVQSHLLPHGSQYQVLQRFSFAEDL